DHRYVCSFLFARHRNQLRAMAQGAKRERFTCGEQNGKEEWLVNGGREALIQANIPATFPKALGFTSQQQKGLRPPAIIDYQSKEKFIWGILKLWVCSLHFLPHWCFPAAVEAAGWEPLLHRVMLQFTP